MGFRIGMIGFGRFGRLAARYLAAHLPLCVHDPAANPADIVAAGAEPADLAQAAESDAVVLAVPISGMRQALYQIREHLKPGSLVIDVCSVKQEPIQWMLEIIPPAVEILGTHPMFGPDSAAQSLDGHKIVLCPVRIEEKRFARIKNLLGAQGLVVLETNPEEHDRQIAVSLALTHFIGRALAEFGAAEQPIDTEGYKRLLAILDVVTHDSWQLFKDMHRFNCFSAGIRDRFMQALKNAEAKLRQ